MIALVRPAGFFIRSGPSLAFALKLLVAETVRQVEQRNPRVECQYTRLVANWRVYARSKPVGMKHVLCAELDLQHRRNRFLYARIQRSQPGRTPDAVDGGGADPTIKFGGPAVGGSGQRN